MVRVSGTLQPTLRRMERVHEEAHALAEKFTGPPGDVYVCDPEDHKGKAEKRKVITILWAPLKK